MTTARPAPVYNWLRWDYWFGEVDTRPLAVFRLVWGLILLKTALYLLPTARLFYSDEGLLPRSALQSLQRAERFSALDWLGASWQVQLFLLLWVGVVVAFTLGYQTRWMTLLNFFFLLSIHERNLYILNGADIVMRVVSFWLIFLPLGDHASLDARRKRRQGQPLSMSAYAFPLRLLQLQIGLIYLATALLKWRSPAWRVGEAVGYALQLPSYTLPTGDWLVRVAPEGLLTLISYQALLADTLFVPLVFAPFWQPRLRQAGLAFTALLHLGIAVTMSVPNFSLVMLACYIIFLEGDLVERVWRWRAGRPASVSPTPPGLVSSRSTGRLRLAGRLLLTLGLSLCMAGVVWINARGVGRPYIPPIRGWPQTLVLVTGLAQYWDMFSSPPRSDGWLIVEGFFADGQVLDMQTGQPPDDTFRRWLGGPWARWKDFSKILFDFELEPLREAVGRYYCQQPVGEQAAGHPVALQLRYRYWLNPSPRPSDSLQRQDAILWAGDCPP